jgi:hypothetical protein
VLTADKLTAGGNALALTFGGAANEDAEDVFNLTGRGIGLAFVGIGEGNDV